MRKALIGGLVSAMALVAFATPAFAHSADLDDSCPVRSYVLSADTDNKNPKIETITGPVSGLVVGQSVANVNPVFTATGAFSIKIRWATTVGGSNYAGGNTDIVADENFDEGSCVGPQGPAGPPGAPGQNGTDGEDGTDGTNGTDGVDGTNGTDGVDGTNGTDGVDGTNGTDGVDGSDGEDGTDGVDGIDGEDGTDGVDGTNGEKGDRGRRGKQGPQGEIGPAGENGHSPELTILCFPGAGLGVLVDYDGESQLPDGSFILGDGAICPLNGEDGATGPAGPTGPVGPAGANGANGADGLPGTTGIQGATGPEGPAGAAGSVTTVTNTPEATPAAPATLPKTGAGTVLLWVALLAMAAGLAVWGLGKILPGSNNAEAGDI